MRSSVTGAGIRCCEVRVTTCCCWGWGARGGGREHVFCFSDRMYQVEAGENTDS